MSLSIDSDTDTAGEREGDGEEPDLEPDSDCSMAPPSVVCWAIGLHGTLDSHSAADADADVDTLHGSKEGATKQRTSIKNSQNVMKR